MTGMYAEERHDAIATLVRSQGRISVREVASTFGVTTETVRRDLASLERAGLLRRVHGGAVPTSALALAEQALDTRDVAQAGDGVVALLGVHPGHRHLPVLASCGSRSALVLLYARFS